MIISYYTLAAKKPWPTPRLGSSGPELFVDSDTIRVALPTLLHTFEVTSEVFDCAVKPWQYGLRQVVDSQSCVLSFSRLLRKLPSLF